MDFDDLDAVPGWFDHADIELFRWFLQTQQAAGISGDVAELGAYLGKSAVWIGSHLGQGETFTVIDLFGESAADAANQSENRTQYEDLSRAAFERNYLRFHRDLPVVVTAPSQSIVDHAAHGTHRFVHVDASHLYEHVRDDIRAARTLLAPDGVVALDDVRSPHTPGVWAAAWEAVLTSELRPIVVSELKMYATWGDAEAWRQRLRDGCPGSVNLEEQLVLGEPLLRVWNKSRPPNHPYVNALTPPAAMRQALRLRAKINAGRRRRARERTGPT
ncbi:MAG: hypothetical protein QOH89_2124 [Pseudonocardiales bacterium]|nr:hypothetical protein [Pseudonocardiales bacterium]